MRPALRKPGKLKLKSMKEEKSGLKADLEPVKIFPEELRTKDKVIPSK